MAKFLVTSGSYFQPFTYDELAKPIMQTVEAHNAAQDAYDTLATETAALRNYISENPDDANARMMYNNYITKLESLQNNLWNNGYNASTRRDLAAARAGYASDITRIATAVKNRQERSQEYWKIRHEHPDMIMGNDPGESGLDNYLSNDLYGRDYYSYSGNDFAKMVGAEASARASEMLNDPDIKKDSRLVGYLQMIERDGFTNRQVDDAYAAVRKAISGDASGLAKLDFGAGILANVLMTNLESSGARGNVSASEFNRLLDYGKVGLAQAVGKSKVSTLADLQWAEQQKIARENERYRHQLNLAALKAAGRGGAGGNGASPLGPPIASLRGNVLSGISDKKQSSDFVDKTNVLNKLGIINELIKAGALRNPNGTLSDAASKAILKLDDSPYYKQLTGGKGLYGINLDETISNLKKEIESMETNDHLYSFEVTPAASANIARNVFKLNIGQLSGKQGDKIAAAYANYANGKKVSGKELMSLLESDNLSIGFDAKSGNITLQRKASDNSQDAGNYNDKVVYLNTRVLTGTSAYANIAQLMYAFDSAVPNDVSDAEKQEVWNRVAAASIAGETVDLRELASFIHDNYNSMVKQGSSEDRAVFNALVESFAQGLFDSSNMQWAPNPYKEGWSAKSGGEYSPYDYGYDDDYEYE